MRADEVGGAERLYPAYPPDPVTLEEAMLARWGEEDLLRRTLEQTANAPEFVFYEGPPTANGRPGIHHVISRSLKDIICRHRTMRGHHVTRISGWDTHGLPVEIEAEKKLGISGKRQIEEIGVARFNEVCRESVFTYKDDWERLSERIGYWLDYSRAYVTFTTPYIETVWWIFQQLDRKGLLYRGHKSVPYCPRCGTTLSSHEVAQGYEDVADPSLYFVAPVLDDDDGEDGRAFLVWTTTPWTLPSNVALALHPELTYVEVEHEGRRLILAESRVEAVFGQEATTAGRYTAGQLAGLRYRRPFDLVSVTAPRTGDAAPERSRPEAASGERGAPAGSAGNAWRTVLEEFVTADDGTGIVHLAPAFGADDYASGLRHGLPMLRPVDDAGRFDASLPLVGGQFVKDADGPLVEDLTARGLVFRYGLATHTYPHCWRCGSPLLYMARDSWFLRTTAVKDEMVAHNRTVDWHPPETGANRFGEWLESNIDWAISRERYWGTPLPAWVCERDAAHIEVIGSLAELAERAGPLPVPFDPHKPFIDKLTWACARCGGTMRRTPEVIDVWFDSGAMPYAQWHYPFENEAEFRRHFPADFICEGIDQTRGWFYSLLAIATMLGDGVPYGAVIVNDMILDAEGQKMSKSKGNVVDPWAAIASFGADAIRWYFMTVSQPWIPKRYDTEALADAARRTFDTLANTYRFFEMYANLEGWAPSADDPAVAARSTTDRWILSRAASVAMLVNGALEAYDVTRAARAIGDLIVDDVSNWYVRRSRDRFYGSADAVDTRAAFRTLHDVLVTVARMLAPIVPFHADWLHRALTSGASVHLASFPTGMDGPRDDALERGMDAVRTLARLGRAARDRIRVRVRQPLRTLDAVVPAGVRLPEPLLEVLRGELNVKRVRFLQRAEELVALRAQPSFRVLGKRFGPRTQEAAAAIRALDSDRLIAFRGGGALTIELDGEQHTLSAEEVEIREEPRGDVVVESGGGFTVALDPTIDEVLRLEGLARELVSRIQRLRREHGFAVSDRIRLGIFAEAAVAEATERHRAYIAGETLAVELQSGAVVPERAYAAGVHEVDLDGATAWIGLERADDTPSNTA
jgi:isoleucyl-tRNA synthetase